MMLASPRFTRFNHLAWIMPPLMLFLGIARRFADRAQLEAAYRAHASRAGYARLCRHPRPHTPRDTKI